MTLDEQGKWIDSFQEVLNARCTKCLPTVGWLMAQGHRGTEGLNPYQCFKAARALMGLMDEDFNFLLQLQENHKEHDYGDLAPDPTDRARADPGVIEDDYAALQIEDKMTTLVQCGLLHQEGENYWQLRPITTDYVFPAIRAASVLIEEEINKINMEVEPYEP